MVYYNHLFYDYLCRCASVVFLDDAICVRETPDGEERRIPYALLNESDARAALRYVGRKR